MRNQLLFLLLWALVSTLYYFSFAAHVPLIAFHEGLLKISDFAYYSVIVRGFWFQGHRGFYNLEDNIEVLRTLTDSQFHSVMPLAVTPVAPFVFLPFSWLTLSSVPLAQSLWAGLSFTAVIAACFRNRAVWSTGNDKKRFQLISLFSVFLFSNVLIVTLTLGQTSLLLLASLLVLGVPPSNRRFDCATVLSCFFIGLKPAYLLFGLFLLAAHRRWFHIALALVSFAVCSLVFTCLSGGGWIAEYQKTFALFQTFPLPATVASAFYFDNMNIFRTAWSDRLPESTLVFFSNRLLMIGVLIAGAFAAGNASLSLFFGRQTSERVAFLPLIFLMGMYYLFSPYIGTYEEVVLVFPLFLLLARKDAATPGLAFVFLLVALVPLLNVLPLQATIPMWGSWLTKAAYFLTVLALFARRPATIR